MEWDSIYEDLKIKNWIIILLFSSISFFTLSPSCTLGIIVGGLAGTANFIFLQRSLKKAFGTDFRRKTKKTSIFFKYYFRLLVLGLAIFILLKYQLVAPVGLIIGLSTIVVAIGFMGICMAFKTKGGEA